MEKNVSDKDAKLQWQLNAVSEVLGDLSLTIDDSLTVGRGSDNDLVLGSKQVSREHAKLYVVNGQLYIKDLDSSNGTYINEVALTAHKSTNVKSNDMVAFANFQFQANQSNEQVVVPLVDNVAAHEPVSQETTSQDAQSVDDTTAPIEDTTDIAAEATDDTAVETVKEEVTASSEKPTTPVNPIVDDVVTEKAVEQEPSAAQPVTNTTAEIAKDSPVEETDTESKELEVIGSDIQNPQSVSTKVEVPVNPLDTTADSNLDKQSTNNTDDKEPIKASEPAPEDKTTKTTLQQEADPDVLRARQVATSQFEPAENNDIGTNQNKAIDQTSTNPVANTEQQEKKSSNSWFIWVFLLIIIIAAIVWLVSAG